MEGQDIYTVVIKNDSEDESLTTVSFRDFDAAVDYAVAELDEMLQLDYDYGEVKKELSEDLIYKTNDYTVWIDSSMLF